MLGGRYVLGERLGRGAVAQVFRAHDTRLRRDVAVKLIDPHVLDDPDALARVRTETRVTARLQHPHLVALWDAVLPAPRAWAPEPTYLVMELVDGTTLGEHVRDRPMPPREVARTGAGLADALAHVHAAGVVHRDVKPANVLLAADGTAKLADFGIALHPDGDRHTGTGLVVGTAGFLAPEQIRGASATAASDVHALGLVLLECLTGAREYAGDGIQAAVARLHAPPVVPARLGPDWRRLLTAMTHDEPARRPTAAAVAEQLHALARAVPPALVPVPRRRRAGVLVGAASALAVLGAVAAVLLTAPAVPETGRTAVPAAVPPSRDVPAVPAAVAPAATGVDVVVEAERPVEVVVPSATTTPDPSGAPTPTTPPVTPEPTTTTEPADRPTSSPAPTPSTTRPAPPTTTSAAVTTSAEPAEPTTTPGPELDRPAGPTS